MNTFAEVIAVDHPSGFVHEDPRWDFSPTIPRPVRSEALRRGLSIASASTSRMGSSSTSRRSVVVPRRRWPQSPSTSRTPTVISPFCASRAKGWSAHDRIVRVQAGGLIAPGGSARPTENRAVEDRRTPKLSGTVYPRPLQRLVRLEPAMSVAILGVPL
jgi:hypothetical protein